jgi:hypothetical protein
VILLMMLTVLHLARWCAAAGWWQSVVWLALIFAFLTWVLHTPYVLARVMSW